MESVSVLFYRVYTLAETQQAWVVEHHARGHTERWCAVYKGYGFHGSPGCYPLIPPDATRHDVDEAFFREWWARCDSTRTMS